MIVLFLLPYVALAAVFWSVLALVFIHVPRARVVVVLIAAVVAIAGLYFLVNDVLLSPFQGGPNFGS